MTNTSCPLRSGPKVIFSVNQIVLCCITDLQYSPVRKQHSCYINKFSVALELGMKVLDPHCPPGPHSRAGNEGLGSTLSAWSLL